jgi:hypothetical protein
VACHGEHRGSFGAGSHLHLTCRKLWKLTVELRARRGRQSSEWKSSKLGRRKQRPMGGQAEPGHSQQGAYAPADPIAPRGEHRV